MKSEPVGISIPPFTRGKIILVFSAQEDLGLAINERTLFSGE